MKQSIQKLFPGIKIYDKEPVVVTNPYSGNSITLTPEEVAVYDYLTGCKLMGDYNMLRKCIDWFIENNTKAYMTLID